MGRKILIFLSSVIITVLSYGNSKLDSLENLLKNDLNETDEIEILIQLGWENMYGDISKGILHINRAKELAKFKKDSKLKFRIYEISGILQHLKGNSEEAIENTLKALEIAKAINHSGSISAANANIGHLYIELGEYNKALTYYRTAFEIDKKNNDRTKLAYSYNNLGNVKKNLEDYDSSLYFHKKSIEISYEMGDTSFINLNRFNIGLIYLDKMDFDSAYQFIHSVNIDDYAERGPFIEAKINFALALIYLNFDSLDLAIKHGLQSYSIAKKSKFIYERMNTSIVLRNTYLAMGDTSTAFLYDMEYDELKDSVHSIEIQQKINELEVRHEVASKDQEIKLLNRNKEIQELTLANRNYFIVVLSIFVVIIVSVSLFMWQRNKQKTLTKTVLLEQKLLRSQMNPHFIFNALNSIQSCILHESKKVAFNYHAKFSKLMRLILLHSKEEQINLSDDLEALKLYMDLEALRTDDKFTYTITIDPDLDTESIKIPPLILQPFIENSIWHGILPKDGNGQIDIQILKENNLIKCVIQDDGIGRKKAGLLKKNNHESVGMSVTKNRIELHNLKSRVKLNVRIIDLENESGTRVELYLAIVK